MILAVKYFRTPYSRALSALQVGDTECSPPTDLPVVWGKSQGKEHSVVYSVLFCEMVLCHALVKPEFSKFYWEGKENRKGRKREK